MSGRANINQIDLVGNMRFREGAQLPIDYEDDKQVINRPKINDKELVGDLTADDLNLQRKLVAGENIEIVNNEDGTQTINALGDGSGELSEDLVVSNPMGKYTMDEVIEEGTMLETIFRGILSKTYYPALTPPSCSITYNAPALVKVGATVAAAVLKTSFNRGSINPKYTAENAYRSGPATNYNANVVGGSITFNQDSTTGEFNIPSFTRNQKGNVVLNATVSYAAGVQPKDSDGNDYQSPLPAGTTSASKSVEFILPFYWGKDSNDTPDVAGLTEDLTKKGNKTYTYTGANDEYLYIVYDSAYGELKSIMDDLNYENIDNWLKSTIAFEGQEYIVYRSNYSITGSPTFRFIF